MRMMFQLSEFYILYICIYIYTLYTYILYIYISRFGLCRFRGCLSGFGLGLWGNAVLFLELDFSLQTGSVGWIAGLMVLSGLRDCVVY